jgi:hypothetical protein
LGEVTSARSVGVGVHRKEPYTSWCSLFVDVGTLCACVLCFLSRCGCFGATRWLAVTHEGFVAGSAARILRATAIKGFSWSYFLARSRRIAVTVGLLRVMTGAWGVSTGMVSRTVILRGPLGVLLGLMKFGPPL